MTHHWRFNVQSVLAQVSKEDIDRAVIAASLEMACMHMRLGLSAEVKQLHACFVACQRVECSALWYKLRKTFLPEPCACAAN